MAGMKVLVYQEAGTDIHAWAVYAAASEETSALMASPHSQHAEAAYYRHQ